LGEFKTQEENSVKGTQAYGTEGCGRACRNGANRASKDAREQNSRKNNSQRRDRPKEQKSNAREGSRLKADKTHQGEGPNPQKDQSRASKEKARPRPREKEDRRPSAGGRPLPITQGLKPTEGSDEERFKSPATNFVPHLAIELAPPPIEEGRPILDIGKHQMKVEGSTRPALTSPADRHPVPQQTWRTTTSRPNHPSRQTNHELNNSSGLQISKQSHSPQQQSRNRGEPKNAQRPQPTNQFEPSPSTQRPYVRCPSAMLCIPKENCDFVGVITEDTIADTPQLNTLRVPLIPCINRAKANVVDVCCRDPNYKDSPWSENPQNKSAGSQHVPVVPEEDYEEDYYDIDIRSQSKKTPRRGGKSGGYGK